MVTKPPPVTQEMVAKGKKVYKRMKCAKCHGEFGKDDGSSADELTDDNDLPITPRDFTDPISLLGQTT